MKVKYTGTSDFQEFGAADFKKADIEQGKLRFAQGEPKEVSDEVGQALISSEGIFGDHSFEEVSEEKGDFDDEDDEDDGDPVVDTQLPKSGEGATTEGTASSGTGTAGRTGAGTSTAARGSKAGARSRGSST